MNLNFISKIPGKKLIKVVVSIASGISMVDGLVSEHKRNKEFEELKNGFKELSKTVSELQKKS